jgi:heme/copper-type cytochrome/quinol oxidase subunit 3
VTDVASYAPSWRVGPLPVGSVEKRGVGWWGVLSLIATEGALFGYLLFSYYYFAAQLPKGWNPDPHPTIMLSGPDTAVLLLSSVFVWQGERGVKAGSRLRALGGLGGGILLGVIFLVVQYFEWKSKHFSIRSGPYGSLFYTITGFHMIHVFVGVIALSFALLWSALGYFDRVRHSAISIVAIYWHFVDAVWIFIFSTFYLSPLVIGK